MGKKGGKKKSKTYTTRAIEGLLETGMKSPSLGKKLNVYDRTVRHRLMESAGRNMSINPSVLLWLLILLNRKYKKDGSERYRR